MTHRVGVLVAFVLVLAACGGGGAGKIASPTTSSSAPTPAAGTPTTGTVERSTTSGSKTAAAPVSSTPRSTGAPRNTTAGTTAKTATKTVTSGIANVVSSSTTESFRDIQPGGTLAVGQSTDIATGFDMSQATVAIKSPQFSAVFDFLVYADPQDGAVKPQIADSITSADGTVWTLRIKPNVRFTDGTAYDAAAIKFNWLRLQDPANAAATATYANLMQSMDVLDARTLKITLKKPNAVFPQAVAQIPFIASPTALQAEGAGFSSNPVGAGPFVFKEWLRDDHLTFLRNPAYWNAPRPYVDQLVVRTIIDETQRINTFLSGALNEVYVASVPNAASLSTKTNAVPNASILNGGILIDFNTTDKPFNDPRARQAVAYAIDRADYVKVVDNGVIEPLDSLFRHDSPYYDSGAVQLMYDPVKAQQLFDQVAADNGGALAFKLSTFTVQNYMTAAQYVQGILNSYRNVKVTVVPEAGSTHTANLNNRSYQAGLTANVFVDPEPLWTSMFSCAASPSPTGWCSTPFDAATAEARAALDPTARIRSMKAAQTEFYALVPALFLERRYTWTYTAPQVQDFQAVNDNNQLVDRVWIKSR